MPFVSAEPLVSLKKIRKTYPGCVANDDVSMRIDKGEIHALLGENGAGKSTLVKTIYGVVKADAGAIKFEGKRVQIDSPAYARSLGIAMVFQHFSLFDSLAVAQNIALGMDKKLDTDDLQARIIEVSKRYGLPLEPTRHVYSLSVGERQRIEIIRCLLQNPKLLIMDEPTSVLTPQEVKKLFATLHRLSDEGMSILYISHKLDEIKALCENATILRHGKKIATVSVEDHSSASLASMMMGEDLQLADHQAKNEPGDIRLNVSQLNLPASDALGISLKNVDLQVRAGEIIGLAGVAGNGQDELLKALNGESISEAASIKIGDQAVGNLGPNERRKIGLVSVPEKRLGHGAVPGMSLVDNALLTADDRMGLSRHGLINYAKTTEYAKSVMAEFDVRIAGEHVAAGSLSGGNLQKFIVGRELMQSPELVVISQPTWGVDAGAAQSIRAALRALANKGAAVLVISQDLDELMEISDQIGAICAGEVSQLYPIEQIDNEKIGLLMAGAA
jgi:simple sugar transport system ATP-binding protein